MIFCLLCFCGSIFGFTIDSNKKKVSNLVLSCFKTFLFVFLSFFSVAVLSQEARREFWEYNTLGSFHSYSEKWLWLVDMSVRLKRWMSDYKERVAFLSVVHDESVRFKVNPRLVLAIIHVESGFKKYAISPIGAQGYMQIMPFWRKLIGNKRDNLFDTRTSVRYGCLILRHYLDLERGDVMRALQRYSGSKAHNLNYPYRVWRSWRRFWK